MAGLNVDEWTPDQVADWLTGLGPSVAQYIPMLKARGLNGAKLLTLRCDDLEYLGIHVIGHQELLLEGVEHLRNFHFELSRECIQQLALRVCVLATGVVRALAAAARAQDARLDTQVLADVARAVAAVKPLACWLAGWAEAAPHAAPPAAAPPARRAALLRLALEAATCAQRERFAERPARAVQAAARAAAAAAAHLARDLPDPALLQPAALAAVTLRQAGKPLGFRAVPSPCAPHRLADVRFGSPAHASGAVHDGDEIVQVGGRCVVGWGCERVLAACEEAARGGELALRLRRRAARPPRLAPRRAAPAPPPPPDPAADSSDESGPLSPPASPTPASLDHTRIFPPKPRALVRRRHTISCGSSAEKRSYHTIDQLWHQLSQQRRGAAAGMSEGRDANDDVTLYARDKAVSYSAGLECARAVLRAPGEERARGKLDKSHSTPAYDFVAGAAPEPADTPIPESPPAPPAPAPPAPPPRAPKADQILDFKKSSSEIGSAMQQRRDADEEEARERERVLETVNIAMMEHRRRSLLAGAGGLPVLRAVPRPPPDEPVEPTRLLEPVQIPATLRHTSKHEARPPSPTSALLLEEAGAAGGGGGAGAWPWRRGAGAGAGAGAARVAWRAAAARGAAAGGVWQRVRGAGGGARWARRTLLLAGAQLLLYRGRARAGAGRAAARALLPGAAVAPAPEVRSRAHCFKVYHTGSAFYFACEDRAHMLAWIQLIHRATLLPAPYPDMDAIKRFSETECSESDSDSESVSWGAAGAGGDAGAERDKSKFGSLKKLAGRVQRSESHEPVPAAASLDRKYLRFFSRAKHKPRPSPACPAAPAARRAPPLEFVHASNPNLLEFSAELGDRPVLPRVRKPRLAQCSRLAGLVTLEQFMLQKQAEERHKYQPSPHHPAPTVPEVIYGEVCGSTTSSSDTGKDGYEKISVGQEGMDDASPDSGGSGGAGAGAGAGAGGERWRDSLRRNDRVHSRSPATNNHSWNNSSAGGSGSGNGSGSGGGGGEVTAGPGVSKLRLMFGAKPSPQPQGTSRGHYPHLQCPPTFQPETYSLAPRRHQH